MLAKFQIRTYIIMSQLLFVPECEGLKVESRPRRSIACPRDPPDALMLGIPIGRGSLVHGGLTGNWLWVTPIPLSFTFSDD